LSSMRRQETLRRPSSIASTRPAGPPPAITTSYASVLMFPPLFWIARPADGWTGSANAGTTQYKDRGGNDEARIAGDDRCGPTDRAGPGGRPHQARLHGEPLRGVRGRRQRSAARPAAG